MSASAGTTIDLMRELGDVYRPKAEPSLIDVPPLRCLMIDGHGDPNGSEDYASAIGALYSLAYGGRFAVKRAGVTPAKVMPLETLWSAPEEGFAAADKSGWDWTAFIVIPESVTDEILDEVRPAAIAKAGDAAEQVRVETLDEGRCAQVMHTGPWSEEAPTIEALHRFIAEQGMQPRGRHHEVYLGDPRRTAPERLRTIIRQPVEPAEPAA